mmetsp:Transcript_86283/g.142920  ORF Transcript_86283/g.142920 Transcript_86283/m.142920 type:complete len:402 (+) Transcript_86283:89-1294(+)
MTRETDQPLLKSEVEDAEAKDKGTGAQISLAELPHWRCGQQRLDLRQKLNTKEIDAAALIKKYDADGSKVLEMEELKKLLQDFNNGIRVKTDEMTFIMKVADKNHDDVISQSEVLTALRAWYAYQNMPSSVESILKKKGIGKGPMPSDETIREILVALNESQPVSDEEVEFLKAQLYAVGGRPDKVTLEDMMKAVATWYLNIARPSTSDSQLVSHGFSKINAKILNVGCIRRLREGEIDWSARGTKLTAAVAVGVGLFLPIMNILIARSHQVNHNCEHPYLHSILMWSGYAGIGQVIVCILAFIVQRLLPDNMTAVVTMWCMFAIFTVIVLATTVYGAQKFLSCSPYRCGFGIWHWGHFVFVMVPMNVALFMCCGIPCIYCYLGSNEFFRSQDIDSDLHKP